MGYPRKLLPFALLGFSLVLPPLRAAALITNGSFESNTGGACTQTPQGYADISAGATCITGWTVTSGTIDLVSTFWNAEDGSFSLDLSGVNDGSIAQTFATQTGVRYNVTFWLAGNVISPPVKTLQVSAAGQSNNYSFDDTGKSNSNMGWLQETFSFTATGTSSTLEFLSTDNPSGNAGPTLDNVTVTAATPETGSLGLMLTGLAVFLLSWGCGDEPRDRIERGDSLSGGGCFRSAYPDMRFRYRCSQVALPCQRKNTRNRNANMAHIVFVFSSRART